MIPLSGNILLRDPVEIEDEESTPVSPRLQTHGPTDALGVIVPAEISPFIHSPSDVS